MKQRGGSLIDYLIYVAVAVAVWAAIALAWQHFVIGPAEARGAAQQAAEDVPVLAAVTKARDDARSSNKRLAADLEHLRAELADANALWKAAHDAELASQAAAARARAAYEAKAREAAAEISGLRAIVAAAPSTEVCNGICAEARDILARLAAERLRD